MGRFIFYSLLLISVSLFAETLDPNYCKPGKSCSYYKAFKFSSLESLDQHSRELITSYFYQDQVDNVRGPASLDSEDLSTWFKNNDDKAAAYYTLSRALNFLQFKIDGEWVPSISFVERIVELRGVRIFVQMNRQMFNRWRAQGAKFQLTSVRNKIETGKFNFNRGDIGGSLHEGFDIQGYTSCCNEPRVQINYRFSDSVADIDLDVAGWFYHLIPNPKHLTYSGSDFRQHLEKYKKKFGDPGFEVYKFKYQKKSAP